MCFFFVLVSCPELSAGDNQTVTVTTNSTLTMATFTCDLHYSLHGNHQLMCLETGNWSGTVPSCGTATLH